MSVHFDPTGNFSFDPKDIIHLVREAKASIVARQQLADRAYLILSDLRDQVDGDIRKESFRCPKRFDELIRRFAFYPIEELRVIAFESDIRGFKYWSTARKDLANLVLNLRRIQSNYNNGNIKMQTWNKLHQCRKKTYTLLVDSLTSMHQAGSRTSLIG
jgi:hypothetical protein